MNMNRKTEEFNKFVQGGNSGRGSGWEIERERDTKQTTGELDPDLHVEKLKA